MELGPDVAYQALAARDARFDGRLFVGVTSTGICGAQAQEAKRPVMARAPLNSARRINEVWSMDFVSDSLANGRRINCLTVADDFSHECVDIAVDDGISGLYVTRLLDQAARFRGYPAAVRTDNGPGFTGRAFINELRPRSSIDRIPPAQYAEQLRRQHGDAARHPGLSPFH
jgi:transposase InsO family protein